MHPPSAVSHGRPELPSASKGAPDPTMCVRCRYKRAAMRLRRRFDLNREEPARHVFSQSRT